MPATRQTPKKKKAESRSGVSAYGPVILVEPNREMLALIEQFLGPEFQIVGFHSLEEALKDAHFIEASVLLCGVPKEEETQTLQALEQMQQENLAEPVPVLALLYEGENTRDSNLHPVFADILPAPFTVAHLRQKIATLLN